MRVMRNGQNRRIEKRNRRRERNRGRERLKKERCSPCKKGWAVSGAALSLRR